MLRVDIPVPEISFTTIGDWAGVQRQFQELPQKLKASSMWGQRKAAEKLVKILKGHIDNQDLGWTPLAFPERSGDPRVLVDYQTYRNNIKTWQKGGERYIGVKKDVVSKNGNRTWQIAAVHEYKSYNGGPYRALWGPSVKELGGAMGVRDIIQNAIMLKALR